MYVIEIQQTGGPEVLRLVERPRPELTGPDDLLVRVYAAGVNPIDTKIRQRGPMLPAGLPAVLGCDGAGVIEAVGEGVTRFKPGDAVWFCHGGLGGPAGNYAEYRVIDQQFVQAKPRTLGMVEAAAAPLVLLTAWEALHDRARIAAGQRVLIHAGAGGVGHVAIQLARLAGARVCTTVSGPEKAALAHELGAEFCINYRDEDLVEAVMDWTEGQGVDIALDTVGPEVFRRTIPAVAHYGDLVTLLDPGPELNLKEARLRNLRLSLELMLTPMLRDLPRARLHQGWILQRCGDLIDRGELRVHVFRTFALAEAAESHRLLERGAVMGKLVLDLDPSR
ncbi:zinc-dependent alcohol dehydrogenase family protein [Thermochromatium tepidum]|uniref:Zinc-binding dehydrogenase n=1 Tax=Thermochromatium tepidum ATCC 43061 TaxID=316276 RepID=A0A6I6DZX7_THETI|nr:zinc-dependent alcohol dehydrogenase family protein [Thermochromatium tepidum]QGU33261.1 zinc-binding dehydrogenase [Thermochromatium tepidum ATCC 43061]